MKVVSSATKSIILKLALILILTIILQSCGVPAHKVKTIEIAYPASCKKKDGSSGIEIEDDTLICYDSQGKQTKARSKILPAESYTYSIFCNDCGVISQRDTAYIQAYQREVNRYNRLRKHIDFQN